MDYLERYQAPAWWTTTSLFVPKFKVKLAMLDTPIHKWNLPGVPDDFEIYIKRDDMTGGTLSGNKVRKLEFILADAIDKGCRNIITCGGIQSNYCRAVAVSARQLGLKAHLMLRTPILNTEDVGCQGNVLIDRLCGARMYLVPTDSPYKTEIRPRMVQLSDQIKMSMDFNYRSTTGEDSYISVIGGSNLFGCFGYMNAFNELISQGVQDNFDDVVTTVGSGGTCEGLAAGNYLTGSKVKVHGIAVCDDAETFYQHGNETYRKFELNIRAEDAYDVIDGYQGQGYGIATQEDYDFIRAVAESTGIILDPTYTGKAARGLIQELHHNPDRFKGKRILFIHTGGIFGAYDGRLADLLTQPGPESGQVMLWSNLEKSPFA